MLVLDAGCCACCLDYWSSFAAPDCLIGVFVVWQCCVSCLELSDIALANDLVQCAQCKHMCNCEHVCILQAHICKLPVCRCRALVYLQAVLRFALRRHASCTISGSLLLRACCCPTLLHPVLAQESGHSRTRFPRHFHNSDQNSHCMRRGCAPTTRLKPFQDFC